MFRMISLRKTRAIPFLVLTFLVSACGGYQEREYGLEEQTLLVLRGESLVGLTLDVDDYYSHKITKNDLTPYKMGMLGAADSEEESLEMVSIAVNPGMRTVRIRKGDRILKQQDMQFVTGQKREMRIR